MPDEPQDAPELPPATLDIMPATNPFACYRVTTVAVGVPELNRLLAQGWDIIRPDFCEHILRAGQGPNQQRAQMVYEVYVLMGKRDPLIETDRQATEAAAQRSTMAAGMPMEAEEGDAGAGDTAAPGDGGDPQAPKVGIPARRTHNAGKGGFEPQGGLRR